MNCRFCSRAEASFEQSSGFSRYKLASCRPLEPQATERISIGYLGRKAWTVQAHG